MRTAKRATMSRIVMTVLILTAWTSRAGSQTMREVSPQPAVSSTRPATLPNAPPDYVIGVSDVLSIVFWREKDLTSDVVVRPDGKISIPLLNEVQAAGFTPEQLRHILTQSAKRFIENPVVTVVVKQVNNNQVFVTGQVTKPGPIALANSTTVLQAIALAGGLTEFSDRKNILITRIDRGGQRLFRFNYNEVIKGKNIEQNLVLKAGDTILVP